MKRTMSLILTAALLLVAFPAAAASLPDVDLSALSFDDLLALRAQIDAALWASDEWQEVTVPVGVYEIGVDIPVGYWTIRPVDGHTAYITWGSALISGGTDIDYHDRIAKSTITSPSDGYAKFNTVESASWELTDGTYLLIEDAAVIFTPYTGPALGFK